MRDGSPVQLLPVVLLLLGIVVGGVRIAGHDADPQRGTAFAMFATVDIGATRRIVATVSGEESVFLDCPDHLQELCAELIDRPSEETARQLGRLLLELPWDAEEHAATEGSTVDRVRVKVVGLDADHRTLISYVLTDVVVEDAGRR